MLIGLAIILIVVGAISIINRLTVIDQKLSQLEHMQYEIDNISGSINGISYEVDQRLSEFMKEQLWVQEKKLDIIDIDNESNIADIHVNWTLRDLYKDEEIALLIRNKDESEWEEHPVTSQSGLNYTFEDSFPITNNYEIQMLATSEDRQRTEKLLDLNIKDMLDSRVTIDAHINHIGVDDRYDLFIFINTNADMVLNEHVTSQPSKMVEIKNANAYIYADGEVYEEIDLLQDNTNIVNGHHYEYFGEVVIENAREVELRVIVEDELGWKYESVQDVY